MLQGSSAQKAIYEQQGSYGPSWSHLITEPLDNLRLLGCRAVLALLGIAVGCMAVVTLLNIGYNARIQAMSVFKGMGSDLLVSSIQPPQGVLITPPEPFTSNVHGLPVNSVGLTTRLYAGGSKGTIRNLTS